MKSYFSQLLSIPPHAAQFQRWKHILRIESINVVRYELRSSLSLSLCKLTHCWSCNSQPRLDYAVNHEIPSYSASTVRVGMAYSVCAPLCNIQHQQQEQQFQIGLKVDGFNMLIKTSSLVGSVEIKPAHVVAV